MTIGEKLIGLRDQLPTHPMRADCVGFSGKKISQAPLEFFPGGLGVNDTSCESISTIVLGSDWGTISSFEEQLKGHFKKEPTVTRTGTMLRAAGWTTVITSEGIVSPTDCLYSNAWPVMRALRPETGYHSMRDDVAFTDAHRDYLRLCIRELEPRIIITLGVPSAWFVGPLVGDTWVLSKERSSRDRPCSMLQPEPVKVGDVVYVAITHPSYPNNVEHRGKKLLANGTLREWSWADEVDLLVTARQMAGIPAAPKWN